MKASGDWIERLRRKLSSAFSRATLGSSNGKNAEGGSKMVRESGLTLNEGPKPPMFARYEATREAYFRRWRAERAAAKERQLAETTCTSGRKRVESKDLGIEEVKKRERLKEIFGRNSHKGVGR